MDLNSLTAWATSPWGMVLIGLGVAVLVAAEMFVVFGAVRRIGKRRDR